MSENAEIEVVIKTESLIKIIIHSCLLIVPFVLSFFNPYIAVFSLSQILFLSPLVIFDAVRDYNIYADNTTMHVYAGVLDFLFEIFLPIWRYNLKYG